MARSNISEVGKRFSSEYQPANRGRKKGIPKKETVLRRFLAEELDGVAHEIDQICRIVFGPKQARKMRKQSLKNLNKFFYGSY
jgi:hypothetical protein